MAGRLLLDTGALVSLFDRSQPLHESCAACFGAWAGPVVSTEAVLTEATHLLGRVHCGRETCLDLFCVAARSWCRRDGSRSGGVAC